MVEFKFTFVYGLFRTEVWPHLAILSGDSVTLWQNNHYLATPPSNLETSPNQEMKNC